jgi:hypothetical protein
MKRDELINRLVARKMKDNGKRGALCVCMAKRICFGQPSTAATARK